ncbi:MAG: DoxX family protein [Phycisphaerales bacterium]|nr:MAG: DoxX family protein [Phycisphaerales bacterium]
MSVRSNDLLASTGLLILRVGFGAYMISHGWGKLQRLTGGEFEGFPDPLGIGSTASLIGAVGAEVFCALLVLIGFATRAAAVPVVFTMAVAAFIIHANDPWTMGGDGGSKEPALLFLFAFLTLICTGPGRLSIDAVLWPALKRKRIARQAAQAGVAAKSR